MLEGQRFSLASCRFPKSNGKQRRARVFADAELVIAALTARHGLSSDASLRKHTQKLEQDGGGRHASDAAGVEGR
jgi:hypothetical protein